MSRWSRAMIDEANRLLGIAERGGCIGRFQLEAAIQSVHTRRGSIGHTDREAIALLYDGLVRVAPTIGALVGRAAATAEARDAATAWALLAAIPGDAITSYQPYRTLAADLLKRLHKLDEAAAAFSHAIGLCEGAATREFLARPASSIVDS